MQWKAKAPLPLVWKNNQTESILTSLIREKESLKVNLNLFFNQGTHQKNEGGVLVFRSASASLKNTTRGKFMCLNQKSARALLLEYP